MTRDELIKTAIKTVIQYAEEQGVKLRRIDFKESKWIFVPDGAINYYTLPFGKDEEVNTVCVKISYHGRWEKQLKIAKERFLNYFNARPEENCLSFSFTAKELEIIAVGRVEGSNDEKIETIIKKINKLLALSNTDKNNSEQEAISASLKVQQLLAKYNLSLADVTGERQEEEVEQSIADVGIGKKWKFLLAEAVASNFACKHFFVGREQICSMATKQTLFPQDECLFICSMLVTGWQTSTQKNTARNTGLQTVSTIAFAKGLWQE